MRPSLSIIVILFFTALSWAQSPIDQALKRYNSGDIPYIDTKTAAQWQQKDSVVFLDTRSAKEFTISHLPEAQFIGYKEFNQSKLKTLNLDKATPIIVYCSIGVRSEQIGVKLKKLGYHNVYNLYGGIFLWYNQGRTIIDNDQRPTREIHGYDQHWAQYIEGGSPRF